MNFKCRPLLLLTGLASLAMGSETTLTSSLFVQDPAFFHQRQAELQKMQQQMSSPSESLDSLLAEADKIAKTSDRCVVVSINDVMDESCWTFYKVELPAFVQRYTKITGEVRLGYMETVRGLQDRKLQIDACANSLVSFVSSKEDNLNLDGNVSLEPLSSGFEANYNFTFQYEKELHQQTLEIAKAWGETCREMVVKQDGESFAPFFIEQLGRLNQELRDQGSLAMLKVDSTTAPTIYVDMAKPVRSAYYLNGTKLFHARISPSPAAYSNLRITFTKHGVVADGENIVKKPNGIPLQYKGSVQFTDNVTKIDGRWFMEGNGNTAGVDFGPEYDEDSLAVAKAAQAEEERIAANQQAAAKAAEVSNRKGLHLSFWAGFTGGVIDYRDSSACSYLNLVNDVNSQKNTCNNINEGKSNASRSYTFFMPDIGAAVRLKYNFGPNADLFATVGVGGMLGLAYGPKKEYESQHKRTYGGLLGQAEAGFKNFGIRETAIFHIVTDDYVSWHQFRTGAFYKTEISKLELNFELGYTIITNAGSGIYASVGTTF